MTKYLDQNGLAYFWTKIKAWLSSHAPVKYFGQNWVEDTNNDYALVVGDGVDENNPENGSVIWNDGRFVKLANDASASTAPASYEYENALEVRDANDDRRLITQFVDAPNGEQGAAFKAQRSVNGAEVYHGVDLRIASDGSKKVVFDDTASKNAWQNALNDWIPSFKIDTDYPIGYVPSSTIWNGGGISILDRNNKEAVQLYRRLYDDGRHGVVFSVPKDSTVQDWHSIGLFWDQSGNKYVYVDAASWRKALGLGTNGALPLTIAQGGSGMTGVEYTNTVSDVITAASGITITEVAVNKWGKIMMLRVHFKRSSKISIPASGNIANFDIGTLKSAYRPKQWLNATGGGDDHTNNIKVNIAGDGVIAVQSFEGTGTAREIAANTTLNFNGVFLIP